MIETEPGLVATLEYNSDLFEAATIVRMAQHFKVLLEGIVTTPKARLSDLPLLTDRERRQLLVEWNNTQVDYPNHLCIHQLFEAQVERTPDTVVVEFEGQHLTYHQLNCRANQLAHHLQTLGIGPEILVGICMERSLEMVIGLLGILKAGGAYVPLDPDYPQERLAFMLADTQVPILLTQQVLRDKLPEHSTHLLCLDTDWDSIASENDQNPTSSVSPDNLAYVIYTSGSTGTPKGVMNFHRGLTNRLLWMQDTYRLTSEDRVLQKTPFSFDVSIWEFFWPLLVGARLVVAKPGGHQDTAYLIQLITEREVTILHFVPSMLQAFLNTPAVETCTCLQRVFCSGEALSPDIQDAFFTHLDAQLHNLYGPTEAAIDVTFWQCQVGQPVIPIGRPITNTQVYILDSHLQPVPIGVAGELHIGGVGLARGYLNRPDLTAERFIPNPFSSTPGTRLYKTGDLARYLPDGNIEFLGRLDHQVKIRGFRIELGEIETILEQHPAVQQAVVLAREDVPGDKRLVAYLVPQPQQVVTTPDLRDFLRVKLPDYMLPSTFMLLEAFPLTSSGKVDRRALPQPEALRPDLAKAFVAPRTAVEEVLAGIWADVLHVEKVGVYDDFFELGGHSLLATQVVSCAQQEYNVELPLYDVFREPTIARLRANSRSRYENQHT